MLVWIVVFFVAIGIASLMFVNKKRHQRREICNSSMPEVPSKEKIDQLLSTQISYEFELPDGFSEIPYHQVLYLEKEYDSTINVYIQANLNAIQQKYGMRSCTFIYLPNWLNNIDLSELVSYNAAQDLNISVEASNITPYFTEQFFNWIGCQRPDEPIVISISRHPANGRIRRFVAFPVDRANLESFFSTHAYISVYPHGPYYQLIPQQPENASLEADEYFISEAERLVDEIRERVNRLRVIGFYDMAIKALQLPTSPSRLLITKEFRIFLTDYNNTEITMTPLPKAVFILFLKHPEGILFKDLPNYRMELLGIYKPLSDRENPQSITLSVDYVTDPYRNSINEKCSRIREAFISHFNEELMKPYFVTGERGQVKKITIDRDYVIWE